MTDNQELTSKDLDNQNGGDLKGKYDILHCGNCGCGSHEYTFKLGIFNGGTSEKYPNMYDGHRIRCECCGMQTCWWHTKEEVIINWNTRAPSKQLATTQQKLATAVEALESILCMHDGNQSPAMNMPDLGYARKVIRDIHREANAALTSIKE